MTTFNFFNTPTNQMISATALAILMYSASAELLLIVCCFLDFQDIRESPSFTIYPITDFLVLRQVAQSESQNASKLLPSVIPWVAA
ncbi:hypothetical protein R3W88_005974 [Solanum pinnatisectum]|uniref:Uncharacterized protein n=1 Tax=Solanum pinnatisectum TaxID=50273 RepID=A0AAV9KDF0_9SOLN|nr:hypothetical protein R3W88_005974 [Solanum pinnatisectum]